MGAPFVWYDLRVSDIEAARSFYRKLLGWRIDDVPAGDRKQPMIMGEDGPWAALASTAGGSSASWVPYVRVENLDQAVGEARSLGATVLQDRSEGPAGSYSIVADPTGAPIALWQERADTGTR